METKDLKLQIKELSDDGQFSGYTAVFGNVDLAGDIINRGAFTKTLQENKGRVVLKRNHREAIGVAFLEEDDHGLKVTKGHLNLDKQSGRDTYSDLKFYKSHGLDMGMSIGWLPVPGKVSHDTKGHRVISEGKLFESTLAELPINQEARVGEVKSVESLVEIITGLKQEIKALAAKEGTPPEPPAASEPPPTTQEPVVDHSWLDKLEA